MRTTVLTALLVSTSLICGGNAVAATATVEIDADDIGGQVNGAQGPESGVWVIAETTDLPTRFIRIVVTDEQGRYVIPDLPAANYEVWVRGYGLIDSKRTSAKPGVQLNLTAVAAPTAAAAAEYYPPNYWYALMEIPADSEFPGTGPKGNGIAPSLKSPQAWIDHLKNRCTVCHQQGTPQTRNFTGHTAEDWYERIRQSRPEDDYSIGRNGAGYAAMMVNNMTMLGPRGVNYWVDWTRRIADGALPTKAPSRPEGIERNVVLSLWDWGDGTFLHDTTSSDRRNPTANANGPVYGTATNLGKLARLDPISHTASMISIPGADKRYSHTPTFDGHNRVWVTDVEQAFQPQTPSTARAAICSDATKNKFAAYWPATGIAHHIHAYNMESGKVDTMEVCFRTHHLNFARDKNDTLFFTTSGYSGNDWNVSGWFETKKWEETGDVFASQGWCPYVLDTNGDGRITPDRTQWTYLDVNTDDLDAERKKVDSKKDSRIAPGAYGLDSNPVDNTFWTASSNYPGVLVRFDRGNNPPESCNSEVYVTPKGPDGRYLAIAPRGIGFDSKGIGWASYSSGQLGRFDRIKCKTLRGPTALGDHCPEGWKIYSVPNVPTFGNSSDPTRSTDWFYQTWVDIFDTLGFGKDVPIVPGSNSDSLIAFLPGQEKFITMRVPYPLGFFTRWADGRIDNPNTGWKGRGAWAGNSNIAPWHEEHGKEDPGSPTQLVKFQVRPNPLAH